MKNKNQQPSQQEIDRELVEKAEKLELTMKSIGWVEIVQPLLDKMISDAIGFKKSTGEWDGGAFMYSKLDKDKIVELYNYRQALIEFNNYLHSHFRMAEAAKKRMTAPKKKDEFTIPLKDTSYDTGSDAISLKANVDYGRY